jgi:hypothetical protein
VRDQNNKIRGRRRLNTDSLIIIIFRFFLSLSSKAATLMVLQMMADIYKRSGHNDFHHKEVEDIAKVWKEVFSSPHQK